MKYFFHLEDGKCIRDPKGEEYPDDASAMVEAMKVAVQLSLEVHAPDWRVVVKNANGIRVGSVPITPDSVAPTQDAPIPARVVH